MTSSGKERPVSSQHSCVPRLEYRDQRKTSSVAEMEQMKPPKRKKRAENAAAALQSFPGSQWYCREIRKGDILPTATYGQPRSTRDLKYIPVDCKALDRSYQSLKDRVIQTWTSLGKGSWGQVVCWSKATEASGIILASNMASWLSKR